MSAQNTRTRKQKHTIHTVTQNARKYSSRIEWARSEPAIYRAARRLAAKHGEGVFDIICRDAGFVEGQYKPIKWTHRSVLYEMRKYEYFYEFRLYSQTAYQMYLKKYKERLRDKFPKEYFKRKNAIK